MRDVGRAKNPAAASTPRPVGRRRRIDPERASRIALAARQIVEERGPSALTHRLVAERAAVPLGSTTYHFASLQALLRAALTELIADHASHIEQWAEGLSLENWAERVADLLLEQSAPGDARRRLLVEYELYILTARSDALRELSRQWDAVLRETLQAVLGPVAGRAVFVVYVGLTLGTLVTDEPLEREEIVRVLTTVGATQRGSGV